MIQELVVDIKTGQSERASVNNEIVQREYDKGDQKFRKDFNASLIDINTSSVLGFY